MTTQLALDAATNSLLIAIVGALGAVLAAAIAVIAPLILKRLGQIHVLVNSNMDALKIQVAHLETKLEQVTEQRDDAENIAQAAGAAAAATDRAITLLGEHQDPRATPREK